MPHIAPSIPPSKHAIDKMVFADIGSAIWHSPDSSVVGDFPHCLLTYSYKGYAGRVDICCSVNIKATIKASRVITVTAIAGNSY